MFLITLSQFITTTFLIIISMFGLTYYGHDSGPMYIITVLGVNISSVIYIMNYEIRYHSAAVGSWRPYLLPAVFVMFYFMEHVFISSINTETSASSLRDVIAVSSLGMWGGTFCYRYNRFGDFAKNMELIMLICTIALVMALPTMFISSLGTSIGGSGDHQIVSYTSAMAFGCSISRYFINPEEGYWFFKNKLYHYLSLPLMVLQALICIVGGGRGGFVTLFVIALFSMLAIKRSVKRLFLFGVLGIAGILFWGHIVEDSNFGRSFMRIFGMFGKSDVASVDEIRNMVAATAWSYIIDSPIWGYGFFHQFDMCMKSVNGPYWHNYFIELLMQGGIILFAIGTSVYFKVIMRTKRIIQRDSNHFPLITLVSYPFVMLLFSGSYMLTPCFWFAVTYVLGYYRFYYKLPVDCKNPRNTQQ